MGSLNTENEFAAEIVRPLARSVKVTM